MSAWTVVGFVLYGTAVVLWVSAVFVQTWEHRRTPLLAPTPTRWRSVMAAGWACFLVGVVFRLLGIGASS